MDCGRNGHSLSILLAIEDKAKAVSFLSGGFPSYLPFGFWCGIGFPLAWGRCVRSGERGHVLPGAVGESGDAHVGIRRVGPPKSVWCLLVCKPSCQDNYPWNSVAWWIDSEEIAGDRRSSTWNMGMTLHCKMMRTLLKKDESSFAAGEACWEEKLPCDYSVRNI